MTDRSPDTVDITITRDFSAPPEAVYRAWTDPAQFGQWFGSTATTVEDVTMDLRVGGEWRARMVLGDGNEIGWHGSYRELDPPRRLVLTLADRPGDEYELVTVDLSPTADGTRMVFTQAGGHMPPEQYTRAEEGWRAFFDDLAVGLADSLRG